MKNYIKYLGILALGIVSCEPEFENPIEEAGTYSSGEADFSNYVALGNSLTAGYADNALYITGQENSYPNILAQKFSHVGGGEFTQPLMADNAGGLLLGGNQIAGRRLVLAVGEDGSPGPVTYTGQETTTEVTEKLSGPYNNMGAPGAKSYHLVAPGYGDVAGIGTTANPYFARFASSAQTTVLEDALAQNPTFFSLWIGNNDVLGYATSGGVGTDQTGNPDVTSYGSNDITDPTAFAGIYSQIVGALAQNDTEGVLVNIPNVTDVPYFTTVPYAPLDPTNPSFGAQIPTLNQMYGQLNQAFAYLGVPERSIVFSETAASAVVVKDESLTDISAQLTEVLVGGGMDRGQATIYGMQFGQARQANENDLIPLPSSSVLGELNEDRLEELVAMGLPAQQAGMLAVNGITYPLEDQHVLTLDEQVMVADATAAYNNTIQAVADQHGLALLDAASLLGQLSDSGITYDGGTLTSEFAAGGAFSLDGVHLTPRGYALVADRIIDEINETYNASIPGVAVGSYNTVTPSNDVN